MRDKGQKDGKVSAQFNGKAKTLFKNSNNLPLDETKNLILLSIIGKEQRPS